MLSQIDRPLKVGEAVAETFKLYGRRPLLFIAIGVVDSAARAVTLLDVTLLGALALVAAAFVVCLALTALVVAGSDAASARRTLRAEAIPLAMLVPVVGIPSALGRLDVLFLVLAILWLAVAGSAVPIALAPGPAAVRGPVARFTRALKGAATLAQAGFTHAILVVLVLVVIGIVFRVLLAGALGAAGDQTETWALFIANAVLSPVLYIGLVVLWADLRARVREVLGLKEGS